MKILTILGTRPEIIRLSRVIPALDTFADSHVLVHTGQNHDPALSDVFFAELGLRAPDRYLEVDTSSFAVQVGDILRRCQDAFVEERPDRVLKLRALRLGVDEFVCKNDDLEELVARVENILTREAIRNEGEVRRARRGITGSLENLSLPDIMQTLTIGMKTACVSIKSNGSSGKIWVESGCPRHAKTGRLEGENAFYAMVRWPSGEFVIEHGVRSKKISIEHDAMFLLMESMRLMDEAAAEQSAAH